MDLTPLPKIDPSLAREEHSRPGPSAFPYLPALDGLRALAVISVLLYHANLAWIPGGFLGVEMFFVISGYLITSLLLSEWSRAGHIDLKNFWLRRARRLFPALFTLLIGVVGYALVFLPEEVAGMRGDILSTAAYINNWYQIFSHHSYFESVGRPSLLRHMWSLAVEEQFYLVWPLLFSVLLARMRPRSVLWVILAGAGASSLAMAALYHPNADPSRVYYGTDTRAAGLLIGAALALVWRPGVGAGRFHSVVLDTLGWFALGTLALCFGLIHEFHPFLYRGGFAVVGLVTAELIAVAVHAQSGRVSRFLASRPLRWVGQRSYGIYLWHFPVFMVTRPQLDVPWDGTLLLAARFLLTVGIAEGSYRWVETPVRNGALGSAWQAWGAAQGSARRTLNLRWSLAALASLGIVVFLGIRVGSARKPAPPAYLANAANGGSLGTDPEVSAANLAPESLWNLTLAVPDLTKASTPTVTSPTNSANALADFTTLRAVGVTGIGDSVMEGVVGELKRLLGTNVTVSADQGRLPWHTPAIVRNLHAHGQLQPVVILHIGNNGYFSPQIFGEIMGELKDAKRIVVVNVKAPRRWESLNNSMLAAAVKQYPQAVLVDWHGASAGRPRIFWKDGIHLRPEGAKIYASLVAQAASEH